MKWPRRLGLALSALVTLLFLADSAGKLLQVEQVMKATQTLGWPASAVFPIGVLLLIGAVLYAVPRTSVVGAIYLTGFLGGAVASHFRLGSPLATHVLFGVYVGVVMWAGLVLRNPSLLKVVSGRAPVPGAPPA